VSICAICGRYVSLRASTYCDLMLAFRHITLLDATILQSHRAKKNPPYARWSPAQERTPRTGGGRANDPRRKIHAVERYGGVPLEAVIGCV